MSEQTLPLTVVSKDENAQQLMRRATDVAGVCREIVLKTAVNIQGKKYVKAEGWMSIATAHGCIASSRDVKRVEGGYTAVGEIRRISDGALLSQAEGFVGTDEKRWGQADEYACRAMAQTRAISRACRAAFAHVVVLMDAGLSTTPAEEVPDGGFQDAKTPEKANSAPKKGISEPTAPDVKKCKAKFLLNITPYKDFAWLLAVQKGMIMDNEPIENMSDAHVPTSKVAFDKFMEALNELMAECDGVFPEEKQEAYEKAYADFTPAAEVVPTGTKTPTKSANSEEGEEWRQFPMPFGKNAGTALEELEKNYLFGLAKNYKIETTYNGRAKKPETIKKDELFRRMLNQAAAHYKWDISDAME